MTRLICSPASDSRNGRMSGMAPATAASNSRSRPAAAAASNSSAPTLASSSLLAVTTGLPALRASRIRLRAGSMPPITSTTTSTSGSLTTEAASWVRQPSGMATPRSLAVVRAGTDPVLRRSQQPKFGDYQVNAAMALGKQVGAAPRDVAARIAEHLDGDELVENVEIAGPGFINVRIRPAALASALASALADER